MMSEYNGYMAAALREEGLREVEKGTPGAWRWRWEDGEEGVYYLWVVER